MQLQNPSQRNPRSPKAAQFITSRLARPVPAAERRYAERRQEEQLEEYISSLPHTRYRVIDKASGRSHIATVKPAHGAELWPDQVITAQRFETTWSRDCLLRLLKMWNSRPSGYLYAEHDEEL